MNHGVRSTLACDPGQQLGKDVRRVVVKTVTGMLVLAYLVLAPILAMQLERVFNDDLTARIAVTLTGALDGQTGALRPAEELQSIVDSMTGPQTPAMIRTEVWITTPALQILAHSHSIDPNESLPTPFVRAYEFDRDMLEMVQPPAGVPTPPPPMGPVMYGTDDSGAAVAAFRLLDKDWKLRGYYIYRTWPPSILVYWLIVMIMLLIAGSLPLGIAWLTGAWLSRPVARIWGGRFAQLRSAAEAWSQGDFGARIGLAQQDPLEPLADTLNKLADRFEQVADARTALALADERHRMARELHDAVKQNLFAATLQIGAAQTALQAQNGSAHPYLTEARRLTTEAQTELTGLIRTLRPAALQGRGLAEAVRAYVADWGRQTGITAEVTAEGAREIPFEVENTLYRVVQGALANVERHSRAKRVEVQLVYQPGTVLVRVRDYGSGFDSQTTGEGLGLRSMRERLSELGGDLTIESTAGHGTTLLAAVPLPVTETQT